MASRKYQKFSKGTRVQVADHVHDFDGIDLLYERGTVVDECEDMQFKNGNACVVQFDNRGLKPMMLYTKNLRKFVERSKYYDIYHV